MRGDEDEYEYEYSDGQATEKRCTVIGPIYLFAMPFGPVGQNPRGNAKRRPPREKPPKGGPTTGWGQV